MIRKLFVSGLVIASAVGCQKADPINVKQAAYVIPGDRFFPGGIGYNPSTGIFYTGSTINGDIAAVSVQTGASEIIASGAKQGRTFCTGIKLDYKDRLWVCGGPTGKVFALKTD